MTPSRALLVRLHLLGLVMCVAVVSIELGAVDAAKIELHVLPTTTLTDEQFLLGARDGRPTTIAAELRFPPRRIERFPVVVVVHGSGGILGAEDRWARELNDMGIAALLLDGFTPRGITTVGADQSQLGTLTMINDAYRALALHVPR
jgi:hypothetical protein